ncbi:MULTISPECIES: hypothetical protein [unclassified Streptomyces]|uniref:hypothetical protein n=1 Tax=unclassified Streptomyces TaxID=2593676 RepID=UPI000ABFA1FF|nr:MULTISPECIES: hypothetical protein [unclassified Streptomyces]MYZ38016.1 hypothetical protein [Streptomyces sp. SID4917]
MAGTAATTASPLARDLLATGPVVGLLHRNEVWHARLFRATDFSPGRRGPRWSGGRS